MRNFAFLLIFIVVGCASDSSIFLDDNSGGRHIIECYFSAGPNEYYSISIRSNEFSTIHFVSEYGEKEKVKKLSISEFSQLLRARDASVRAISCVNESGDYLGSWDFVIHGDDEWHLINSRIACRYDDIKYFIDLIMEMSPMKIDLHGFS